MGKLTILISTTPDGFAESKHVIIDPDFFNFTHALMDASNVLLFGRKTFEQFQERWAQRMEGDDSPDYIRKMAQSLHEGQKIVFSSTLKTTSWHRSTIVEKLDADVISSFKRDGKNLLTFGSFSLIESLVELNLVDEYYFNIQPLLSGHGEARFFNTSRLSAPRALKYIDYTQLPSGAHIIHYQNGDLT